MADVDDADVREQQAKKAAANKKKKARQKAAKALKALAPTQNETWREAGPGRGKGMFANRDLDPEANQGFIADATPALSIVFDDAVDAVCGLCFATTKPRELDVELRASIATPPQDTDDATDTPAAAPTFSFGVVLDDGAPGTDDAPRATVSVSSIVAGGANDRGASAGVESDGLVLPGDVLLEVDGDALSKGDDKHSAASRLKRAASEVHAAASGPHADTIGVRCRVLRPGLIFCRGCRKFSACSACVAAGRLAWHKRGECSALSKLASKSAKGDSSVLRLLLRYKQAAASADEMGTADDWKAEKESVAELAALQRNAPLKMDLDVFKSVSSNVDMSVEEIGSIVFAIRANACEVRREGRKVGSALSVLLAKHNHDCDPNAEVSVTDEGLVRLRARKPIREGEEVTVCYVDAAAPVDERRNILEAHYGFRCNCARCGRESLHALKQRSRGGRTR